MCCAGTGSFAPDLSEVCFNKWLAADSLAHTFALCMVMGWDRETVSIAPTCSDTSTEACSSAARRQTLAEALLTQRRVSRQTALTQTCTQLLFKLHHTHTLNAKYGCQDKLHHCQKPYRRTHTILSVNPAQRTYRHRDLLAQCFPTSLSYTIYRHSTRTGITLAISEDYHERYSNLKYE